MIHGSMKASTSRFWLWRMPASVGVLATLLFAGGFWLALRGPAGRPVGDAPAPSRTGAPPAARPGGRLLLVLGDSLARGTGDEVGRGFAADVLDALKKKGPAQMANLAVNGAESAEVRDLVATANVRSLAASADWILLSVGGNDLSHAVPRGGNSAAAPIETVSRARETYASNLRAILATLREASPSARIRIVGLYDPFEDRNASSRVGDSVILGWNTLIQETALDFSDVLVIPTFDLFALRPDRLALDRFHPNRAGYSLIAARILQGLPAGP
jgi:lysophospholipase L1-like esterase